MVIIDYEALKINNFKGSERTCNEIRVLISYEGAPPNENYEKME